MGIKLPDAIIELIRVRAYEKWAYRKKHQLFITTDRLGNPREITPEDDWLEAENQVIKEIEKDWR